MLHIAIDGPVGSGKSDISSRLAKRLGVTYLYTGAMYRALGWLCQKENVARNDEAAIVSLLSHHTIALTEPPSDSTRAFAVLVDGMDVTDQLFTPEMDIAASDMGIIPVVRFWMVTRQQALAQGKSVVMEGRDIGIRVLPDADLKIYLTAAVDARARRRWKQMQQSGSPASFEEVLADTKRRDIQDTSRATDPLQKLPDAWELDATGLTQEEVVNRIVEKLKELHLYPNR
jgi:cytidylate kinase